MPTQNRIPRLPMTAPTPPLMNLPRVQTTPPSVTSAVLLMTEEIACSIPAMGRNRTGPIRALEKLCIASITFCFIGVLLTFHDLSFQILSSFRGCTLPFRWLDYITLHKKIYRFGLFLNLFAKAETCFTFMLDTSKCLLTKYTIQRILQKRKSFFDSEIGAKHET